MARIAITGGSGFIGTAVVEYIKEKGDEAQIIDRVHGQDILSENFVDYLDGCDAVIHLAGKLGTDELFDDPYNAIDVNIKGALRVLQACELLNIGFVGITMPNVWYNVYQATKQAAKLLATAWHIHRGVPVSHVKAYNAFGPWQHVRPVQKIVPTFATRAWRNQPIPIWGDGTQCVDLIYSKDIARMLVDALQFGDDRTFDAGTGVRQTVNEVANMVLDITGSEAGIEYLPMRRGEHAVDICAGGEGWDALGWKPEFNYSDFEQTVLWYREDRP